jgi:hypothetical protein
MVYALQEHPKFLHSCIHMLHGFLQYTEPHQSYQHTFLESHYKLF